MAYQLSGVIYTEERQWYNSTQSWGIKGFNYFSNDISPKGNVIARLEFELVYFVEAVQHFSHYATRSILIVYYFENETNKLMICNSKTR